MVNSPPQSDAGLVAGQVLEGSDRRFCSTECSEKFPDVLDWGIPYEIVVLADYGGSRKCDPDGAAVILCTLSIVRMF